MRSAGGSADSHLTSGLESQRTRVGRMVPNMTLLSARLAKGPCPPIGSNSADSQPTLEPLSRLFGTGWPVRRSLNSFSALGLSHSTASPAGV